MTFMLKPLSEVAAKLRQAKSPTDVGRVLSQATSSLSGVQVQLHPIPSPLPNFALLQQLDTGEERQLVSPWFTLRGARRSLTSEHKQWLTQVSDWTLDILHGLKGRTRHGLTSLPLDADFTGLAESLMREVSTLGVVVLRFEELGPHFLPMLDIIRARFLGARLLSAGSGADGVSVLWPQVDREALVEAVGTLREELEQRFSDFKLKSARVSMGVSYFPEDTRSAEQLVAGARIGARRAAELPGNRIHAMVASGQTPGDGTTVVAVKPGKPPSHGSAVAALRKSENQD